MPQSVAQAAQWHSTTATVLFFLRYHGCCVERQCKGSTSTHLRIYVLMAFTVCVHRSAATCLASACRNASRCSVHSLSLVAGMSQVSLCSEWLPPKWRSASPGMSKDPAFCGDVERDALMGKPRCQREGSSGRRYFSIFACRCVWLASHGLQLRALAPDSVLGKKLRPDKDRRLAHRLRGVVVDCAGRPGCSSGSCGTCHGLRCQHGRHQVQHSHPHVVEWHRSKEVAPSRTTPKTPWCASRTTTKWLLSSKT